MRETTPAPRVVVITGASSGLGAALARVLAAEGHRLTLVARRAGRLDAVAAEVRARGGEALALAADLTEPDAPARVVSETVARFGRIDALVNNAGVGLPRYYSESDPAALREQVAVNFLAPVVLTRHALPHLVAARGTVINVGSAVSAVANPMLGAYGATKAGLAYWNDALRRELRGRGVSVCLVDLGPVATEFFEAVRRRTDPRGPRPLGIDPAPDALYNALRDRPPAAVTTTVDDAARRVARLLDRPRRRLRLPRRLVWPFRVLGLALSVAPGLTDLAVAAMIRRVEREEARPAVSGDPPCDEARPARDL